MDKQDERTEEGGERSGPGEQEDGEQLATGTSRRGIEPRSLLALPAAHGEKEDGRGSTRQ